MKHTYIQHADNQTDISFHAFSDKEDAIRLIRNAVFVEEQGVPIDEEFDDDDHECVHVIVIRDAQPIGTGRLRPDGRIGRIAVLEQERGRGIGKAILVALEQYAKESSLERLWAHAQVQALGLYEGLGYCVDGESFMEAGISHKRIHKPINPNGTINNCYLSKSLHEKKPAAAQR